MIAAFCSHLSGQPSTLEGESGFAWSENTGWVNAGNADYGLVVKQGWLEGFAWAENIGWIVFGDGPENGLHYQQLSGDVGVNRSVSTGELTGYAWSENVGWIRFGANDSDNATMNDAGVFAGYVWSENIGWISIGGLRRAADNEWDGIKDSIDPDDDNDLLPDTVELSRGFDPTSPTDGLTDHDKDGETTGEEYVAGTDYLDKDSTFKVDRILSPESNQFVIRWHSVPGKAYELMVADDVAGPYRPTGNRVHATEGISEASYISSFSKSFFRVRIAED